MALAETAQLIVDLQLRDGLTQGVAVAKGQLASLEAQAATATNRLGGFGGALKTVALGLGGFAVLGGLTEVLSAAVKGAIEEESSIQRLTTSLKANDEAWDGNLKSIEDVLAARMRLGHSDDDQRTSLSLLVAATHNVKDALDAERVAMDLAAFKRISLAEASQALIQVEAGRYRGLASLGIQIKANATQEEALAAVQKIVQGSAEDLANTTEGKLNAANVKLGEALEKIGGVILPPLAEGMGVLADVVGGVADVFKGFGDILGGVGDTIGGVVDNLKELDTVHSQEAQATIAYNLALTELQQAFAEGKITQEEYIAKSKALADSFDAAAQTSQGFTVATEASGVALDNVAGRAIAAAQALNTAKGATEGFNGVLNGLTQQTGTATDAIAQFGGQAVDSFYASKKAIEDAKGATDTLADSLQSLPREITIDVITRFTSTGAGATSVGTVTGPAGNIDQLPDATGNLPSANSLSAAEQAASAARRQASQAAEEAARRAKQAAEELARANRDKVAASYNDVKRASETLFDSLHARHIKAIEDALKLAQTQHDGAIQRINDALAAQEAENAKPVNAAQAALNEREQAQQRRNLVEAEQAAAAALQKNTDPTQTASLAKALRDATEALENFDARATIGRLTTVQQQQDAAAEAQAQKARDQADADLEAAKAKAAADEQRVNKADAANAAKFEAELEKLRQKDANDPRKFLTDVTALQARFGIFTDPVTGFRHIADTLPGTISNAIAKVKIPAPVLNQKFYLQIGTGVAREIFAAGQAANQPAASSGVRTGQGGRNG